MRASDERIILTDVDGVMLSWFHTFDIWMSRHGYHKVQDDAYEIELIYGLTKQKADDLSDRFNESASIGSLPPLRDALKYVRKLHEEYGYVFHCITAIPNDPNVKRLRQSNLEKVFGASAIERLECVQKSIHKEPILAEYQDTGFLWLEDKWKNAKMGQELGLQSVIFDHPYNRHFRDDDIIRVKNWQELYERIT
jgi:hypothetical protein